MTCIACKDTDRVQYHHLIPKMRQADDINNADNNVTIPLCHRCHLYMAPVIHPITYTSHYEYYRYNEKEANTICRMFNKNTEYLFKVSKRRKYYKTVPFKDFICIEMMNKKGYIKSI